MLTFDVLEALISGTCPTASIGEYVYRVIFPSIKRKKEIQGFISGFSYRAEHSYLIPVVYSCVNCSSRLDFVVEKNELHAKNSMISETIKCHK